MSEVISMIYEELQTKHGDIVGFESADCTGWYHIEDKMYSGIKAVLEKHSISRKLFHLEQEKEKFGELRTYWDWSIDKESDDYTDSLLKAAYSEIQAVISAAATESANTCYLCGNSATVQSKGWILPYCQACAEKQSDYPAAFRPSRPI